MTGDSIIDRVRVVIEQVGENQSSFASMVGMTEDKLSKSLKGTRRFTSLELALVAEVGRVSVDWLLSGKAPARPMVAARTIDKASLDIASITELVDRHMAAFDVLDLLGEGSVVSELPPVSEELQLWEQGEALATHALERMYGSGLTVHKLEFAVLANSVEQLFGIDVVVGSLPDGLDGLAWQKDGRRLIFLPSTRQWTRQRFTFAHELCHVLAGDAQQILVDQNLSPGKDAHPSERRANSFAAAFLMPAKELRGLVSGRIDRDAFAELVVSFKVSPSAMAARLRSLGLLQKESFEALRRLTSLDCHELAGNLEDYVAQVNGSIAARLPSRLVQSLFEAYRDGRTTLRPLANLLSVDVGGLHEVLSGTPEFIDQQGDRESNSELVYSL
ncbi:hypothetical protein Cme02nite_46600 [Catellatospora methionotrophica]|uniref:IrrE N-terminal-like domain-containing protein n=1 Tax=Catellatospora methionotrophica TaxID=121620 RepID=A0A8J3L8G4_9ACTN|nr:ImmA/IrrE family metallo-endopeptidase [Catellatospora methionotrophica]GIG16328.1 hypothetical protein Cme02nite_46600 [Catellatospora methionotrophica]